MKSFIAWSSPIALALIVGGCSTGPTEDADKAEQMAVADVDHMIRRADGTFDVYCADGTVEHSVPPAQIVANQVCLTAAGACPGKQMPKAAAWMPPPAAATSCSAEDVAFLQAQAQQGGSIPQLEAALYKHNENCAFCVFTTDSDAKWGPIVYTGTAGNAFINWGACFARAPGGSDACGAAFHKQHNCSLDICQECADDQFGSCYQSSFQNGDTCGSHDVQGACGDTYSQVDQACASVWDIIKFNCGGGTMNDPPVDDTKVDPSLRSRR